MTEKKKIEEFEAEERKSPRISNFGRCTREQRETCPNCSAKGKILCGRAKKKYKDARTPRKGPKGNDKRPFTSLPHEVIRWSLGTRYDYLHLTYLQLVSWTSADTYLVFRSIKSLAAERNVTLARYYEHLSKLEKLELIERHSKRAILGRGRRDEKVIFVSPLPAWVPEIFEQQTKISKLSKTDERKKLRKLKIEQLNRQTMQEKILSKLGSGEKSHG